jgi:hypothetical protein
MHKNNIIIVHLSARKIHMILEGMSLISLQHM